MDIEKLIVPDFTHEKPENDLQRLLQQHQIKEKRRKREQRRNLFAFVFTLAMLVLPYVLYFGAGNGGIMGFVGGAVGLAIGLALLAGLAFGTFLIVWTAFRWLIGKPLQ